MAEGEKTSSFREICSLPKATLGKRITDLSCYHAILQKLGVLLYTDIRGEEGNWERLAEELGTMTVNEVENIRRHASLEKIFPGSVLLKRWSDNPGSTVYVLLQALKKLGREDCVMDVWVCLEEENNMELHVSIEDEAGTKEFITVKTKKDASLGSSLENTLGSLVCYDILGPDNMLSWYTAAIQLKGRQLSLRKVVMDDDRRNSIYEETVRQYPHGSPTEMSAYFDLSFHPIYPANIPIGHKSSNYSAIPAQQIGTSTSCGAENEFQFHYPTSLHNSQTDLKHCSSNSSLTKTKMIDFEDSASEGRHTLTHSKSIDNSNFQSLTDVKKFEKDFKDLACKPLKKSNSTSDITDEIDLIKRYNSTTVMDTSCQNFHCEAEKCTHMLGLESPMDTDKCGPMNCENLFCDAESATRPSCQNFNCDSEKCTHSLMWDGTQLRFINPKSESLDITQDCMMDAQNSLEICTPLRCSPDDNMSESDYIPHNFVVVKRKSGELSSPGLSPMNSPPRGAPQTQSRLEQTSPSQSPTDTSVPKRGENQSQVLLRTALRRSFEKKIAENKDMPAPQPCKPTPTQHNQMYTNSIESGPGVNEGADNSVTSLEEELSKRPAQCRLPVTDSDGYIPMDSHSALASRPTTLPMFDSSHSYVNIARRPLPARPRQTKSTIIHSYSEGDMILLTPDQNEYSEIDGVQEKEPRVPVIPSRKNIRQNSQPAACTLDTISIPGWCSSITEDNVAVVMNKFKNEDGNFMVWKMKDNTFVITVSHLRDLRHYAIHCRNINGQMHYFIFNGGFMTTTIGDLVYYYQKEGLKGPDPMLDGSRGKKWQKYSHVQLKHPMKSRNLKAKD